MALQLRQTSALNLELEGSTGSFRVGAKGAQHATIEVKYFLTHVSLDFQNGPSEQVLGALAPVRELFETDQLEFDEIMQRDIDDARVSAELIPYLLDKKSRDMVKLFPPIVVVVLPTMTQHNRPADKYPEVTTATVQSTGGHEEVHTRAGQVGQEVFEFIQPILNGRPIQHDLNRLKLNTSRTRLVIVDGQHRAMALLALYRNLMQDWANERRAPYKDFYEEWTPNYIRQFQLDEISLPVMFCTFPELDEKYDGDFDLKQAARSIFLTLNKTARKVSESRNRLLDDDDLVSLFMRATLSDIKDRDARSLGSLRIFNVELDQSGDRMKIESPIAITGVNHIYYVTEHLLLNKLDDVKGISPRKGKLFKRVDLEFYGAYRRLDGRNRLGAALADATNRTYFTREAGKKLAESYHERFGQYVRDFFVRFAPIEAHCRASLWLEQYLNDQENRKLRPILFEGQGMSRVFDRHREILRDKLKNNEFGTEATKVEEIIRNLNATAKQIDQAVERFKFERAANLFADVADKGRIRDDGRVHPKIVGFVTDLFNNVFSSVAFQTAGIATFFGEIERASNQAAQEGLPPIDIDAEWEVYLASLHAFFVPKSAAQLRNMIEVFVGKPDGDLSDWKIAKTPNTFHEVVSPGEMQPDQWPKYKYMMLELWRPSSELLQRVVSKERDNARAQVFKALENRKKDDFLRIEMKREDKLSQREHDQIKSQAYQAIRTLLNNLGWALHDIPSKTDFDALGVEEVEEAVGEVSAEEEEVWESVEEATE